MRVAVLSLTTFMVLVAPFSYGQPALQDNGLLKSIALRSLKWLLEDDWGQQDRAFGDPGSRFSNERSLTDRVTAWRARSAARTQSTVVVRASLDRARQMLFTYDTSSKTLSEVTADEERSLSNNGPRQPIVRVAAHWKSDNVWTVDIDVGMTFVIQVTSQKGSFVVQRFQNYWIFD